MTHTTLPLEDCDQCNVVVIVVDTLRADHLPFYGYARNTAPFLTELAKQGVVFTRTFSASSWTAPATASIFTSMLPSQHRVITGFAATKDLQRDNPEIKLNRLPQHAVTIAEYMHEAGYKTIGVTDNINIGSDMGFDRGFDRFSNTRSAGAERVNEIAKNYVSEPSEKPYFLYLHYMDPHSPYISHDPWFSACSSDSTMTKRERVVCAYDSEIAHVDSHIAELFQIFGWKKNAIVFFTSDHGEEFWDHGLLGHGKTLYTELVHVPFLVYHPDRSARRVDYTMQSFDILPTLARLMDQQKDPEWEGKSVRRMLRGEPPRDLHRVAISERLRHIEKDAPIKKAIALDNWHYIETTEAHNKNIPSRKELYDLLHDFQEKRNLHKDHREISDQLAEKLTNLRPLLASVPEEDDAKVALDEETIKQLKSLGYF